MARIEIQTCTGGMDDPAHQAMPVEDAAGGLIAILTPHRGGDCQSCAASARRMDAMHTVGLGRSSSFLRDLLADACRRVGLVSA